jgi:hypothetical protein
MAISGIVIVFNSQLDLASEARVWLEKQDDLELGEAPAAFPERLPAVLDGLSSVTARDRLRELESHPGVLKIDVIHVGFDDTIQPPSNPFDRPGRRTAVRGTPS